MKQKIKYSFYVGGILFTLFLSIPLLLYIPTIQNFAKNIVVKYISEKTDYRVSIGEIRLSFPLALQTSEVWISSPICDTLVYSKSLSVSVKIWPLLKKEIEISHLDLVKTTLCYKDSTSGFSLKTKLEKLRLSPNQIDLANQTIAVSELSLSEGDIEIQLSNVTSPDSMQTQPSGLKWIISANRIDLDDISYKMQMNAVGEISASLDRGWCEKGKVSLAEKKVDVSQLIVNFREIVYLHPDFSQINTIENVKVAPDSSHSEALAWEVAAEHIRLSGNELRYQLKNNDTFTAGLDMNLIGLKDVVFEIDSFYNKQTTVKGDLKQMAFTERCGLKVTQSSGYFEMDSTAISLTGFSLKTPYSSILASASSQFSAFRGDAAGKLGIDFIASIGWQDLKVLYPSLSAFPNKKQISFEQPLKINTQFSGNLNRFHLDELQVSLAPFFSISAIGDVRNLNKPLLTSGMVKVIGDFNHLEPFMRFVPDTVLQKSIAIPDRLKLWANIDLEKGNISPTLKLTTDSGRVEINGFIQPTLQVYKADIQADSLQLRAFLPQSPVGLLSLSASAEGKGFDMLAPTTQSQIALQTQQCIVNGYNYNDIRMNGNWKENYLDIAVTSGSSGLDFTTQVTGIIQPKEKYDIALKSNFNHIDLKHLHLSPSELQFSFGLDGSFRMNIPSESGELLLSANDIVLTRKFEQHKLKDISFKAVTDSTHLIASLLGYGIQAHLKSGQSLRSFMEASHRTSTTLQQQIDSSHIDLEKLQQEFPQFELRGNIDRHNIIASLLKSSKTKVSYLSVEASAAPSTPFGLSIIANGLQTNQVILDTVTIGLHQQGKRLDYGLDIGIQKRNVLNLSQLSIGGYIAKNRVMNRCFQKNKQQEVGFDFSSELLFSDSVIHYAVIGEHPIFGFEPWTVNPDNYIDYFLSRHDLVADFKLTNPTKELSVISQAADSTGKRPVDILLKGIELSALSELAPTLPQLGGVLEANLELLPTISLFEAEGDVTISQFSFDKKPVGNLYLDISGRTHSVLGYKLNAGLDIDQQKAVRIEGTCSTNNQLEITLRTPQFPMRSLNAFMPPATGEFTGWLKCGLHLTGTVEDPVINGAIQLDQSMVKIPLVGSQFTFSQDSILIHENKILFDRYAIIAPNRQSLLIDGRIMADDFSQIMTNLTLTANNLEVVNMPKNNKTILYGKAFVDLNTSLQGVVDELSINGSVRLLNGTEVTYILPSGSTLDTQDKNIDMVTFVSFADSVDIEDTDSVPSLDVGGIHVTLNVAIDNNVKMGINLTSDGNSRINVQGGGNLSYTLNTLGDSRFTGRYNITGGTVRYNPPIISEKLFSIQQGSYVEWIGNIANPTLHITATENVRSYVVENNQNGRMVDFDVIVAIKNALDNMSLTFDLKTPNDISIATQLASLTEEQRSAQAMNLLLYNSYTGPGTTSTVNIADNPINSFIQKEINQWARNNLKNIDFSIGIDQRKEMVDGIENSSTNYSYQISKTVFNERFKIVLGGGFDTDQDTNSNLQENLINDISLEYMLNKRKNMLLRLFRETNYESILEGEVTQNGIGFVVRKRLQKLKDLFRLRERKENDGEKK